MQLVKNPNKVAISFLSRDCENSLRGFLIKIEKLRSFFISSKVYILENGSKDSTRDILKEYQASSASVILNTIDDKKFDKLPPIEKMAKLRNTILDMVRNSCYLPEYYIVIDGDLDFDPVSVVRAIQSAPDDWSALFANGRYFLKAGNLRIPVLYYDLFAYLPFEKAIKKGDCLTQEEMIELRKSIQKALRISPYFKCRSAFGGVGIYRYDCLGESRYSAERNTRSCEFEHICEHIPFNREIAKKGKLYICRDMKVYYEQISFKTWLKALAIDNNKEKEMKRIKDCLNRLFSGSRETRNIP